MEETLHTGLWKFLNSIRPSVRVATISQYEYLVGLVITAAGIAKIENCLLSDLVCEDMQGLITIIDNRAYFPGVREQTVAKVAKLVRRAFGWFSRRGWVTENFDDLAFRRVYSRGTEPFTVDELLAILSLEPRSPAEFRDMVLWHVAADTGARRQELCSIMMEDLMDHTISIRVGKGGKPRRITVGDKTWRLIDRYMNEHRPKSERTNLFLTEDGLPLDGRYLAKRLDLWARRAGVSHATPHRFRSTFATQFVQREGGDLVKLQALLGHSTLDMSRRYIKLAVEDEARLINRRSSLVDSITRVNPAGAEDASLVPVQPAQLPSPAQMNVPSMDPTAVLAMMQVMAGIMQMMMGAQTSTAEIGRQPAAMPARALPSFTVNNLNGGR